MKCSKCEFERKSKAVLVDHMVADHWREYATKAAAKRSIEKRERRDSAQARVDAISALGFTLACSGCKTPLTREMATYANDSAIGSQPFCSCCYREIPSVGRISRNDSGSWQYGYGDRFCIASGYRSAQEAEARLRAHVASNLSRPGAWLDGLDFIVDQADRKEFIGHLPWYVAANRLGRAQTGIDDAEFRAAEAVATMDVAAAL